MPVASVAARTIAPSHDIRRERADLRDVHLAGPLPGGQREHRVAVALRVRRKDRAREPIVGHQCHAVGLRLGEAGIGGDEADGGVLRRPGTWPGLAGAQQRSRVGEAAIRVADPGDDLPGVRIDDVADGVDRDDGAHAQAVGQGDAVAAHASLHGAHRPARLAHCRARARADRSFLHRLGRRSCGSAVAAVRGRTNLGIAANRQVEQDGGGHDWDLGNAHVPTDAVLLEPADCPGGRLEPEGAAARQDDGVHLVHHVGRIQEIGFARARCAAALRNAARGPFTLNEDDRYSRSAFRTECGGRP